MEIGCGLVDLEIIESWLVALDACIKDLNGIIQSPDTFEDEHMLVFFEATLTFGWTWWTDVLLLDLILLAILHLLFMSVIHLHVSICFHFEQISFKFSAVLGG